MDTVESFVKKFEDKRTLKYCRAVEEFQLQLDEQMEVDDAIETLRNASINVAVKSTNDWKQAIIDAAHRYELGQVSNVLTTVHQEYIFRVENSINFPQSMIDKKREEYAFHSLILLKVARLK